MNNKISLRSIMALASALTIAASVNVYANNPLSSYFSGFWGNSHSSNIDFNKQDGSSGKGSGSDGKNTSSGGGSGGGASGGGGSGGGGSGSGGSGSGGSGSGGSGSGGSSSGGSSSSSSDSSSSGSSSSSDNTDSTGSTTGSTSSQTAIGSMGLTFYGPTQNSDSANKSTFGSGAFDTDAYSDTEDGSSSTTNSPFGGGPGSSFSPTISTGSLSGLSGTGSSSSSSSSSLTIDEIEAVSISFVMYLNSTFYQLPYGYALAPEAIQSNLRLINANNQSDSNNFDASMNFQIMTTLQNTAGLPIRVVRRTTGTTTQINYGLLYNVIEGANPSTFSDNLAEIGCDGTGGSTTCIPRNVSLIISLFCDPYYGPTSACASRLRNFSSVSSNLYGDPLLYALTTQPTSSALVPLSTDTNSSLQKLLITNAESETTGFNLPGTNDNPVDNGILTFSTLFNSSISSITSANYFVEFATAAYISNMALNPCFNNPSTALSASIQASASSAASSSTGSSSSTSSALSTLCSSGYHLATDIKALLATDRGTSSKCSTNPADDCLLYTLQKATVFKQYQLDMRTLMARNSVLSDNMHHLFEERLRRTYTATTSTTGSLLIDAQPTCSTTTSGCSMLDLERFIANHRLQNLNATSSSRITWFDRLKTASPSLLARERTLMMAEMLQLQERNYELTERILATNTVQASKQSTLYNQLLIDVKILSEYAEEIESSALATASADAAASTTGVGGSSDSSSSSTSETKKEAEENAAANNGSNNVSNALSSLGSGANTGANFGSNSTGANFGADSTGANFGADSTGSVTNRVTNQLNSG